MVLLSVGGRFWKMSMGQEAPSPFEHHKEVLVGYTGAAGIFSARQVLFTTSCGVLTVLTQNHQEYPRI